MEKGWVTPVFHLMTMGMQSRWEGFKVKKDVQMVTTTKNRKMGGGWQ